MNIFFGKISKKFDLNQIEEGYYLSPKGSTWFGEIEIGDYAYIIGGDKIQLWKAREWGKRNEEECLWFEIINKNLNLKLNKFTALEFFKLTPALIVLTSRSARNRAFFKLETIRDLTIEYISDPELYKHNEIYRKIVVHESKSAIDGSSINIQLYYENGDLKLFESDFFDKSVIESFRDNLKFGGKGAIRKDNVIKLLKSKALKPSAVFTNSEISMRSLYDTLFCGYTEKEKYYVVGAYWDGSNPPDQTKRFLDYSIWENGYEDKFLSDVKNVSVGSHIAIKAVFTREKTKSVMSIKARGIVIKNHNDGRLLDVEWEDDFTPFEVDFSGGYWETIKEVKKTEHINSIWNDSTENPAIIDKDNCMKFPLNQILYGPPGTGKTYNTVLKAAQIVEPEKEINDFNEALKIFNSNLGDRIEFITFHQSYSYEDFIQGLRPDVENEGSLSFERKDGVFKRISDIAHQNLLDSYRENDAKKDFDLVFSEFISPINEGETHKIEVPMKKVSLFVIGITRKSIEFRKNDGDSIHTLSIDTLRKMYIKGANDIILGGLQPYYNPILDLLLKMGKSKGTNVKRQNYVLVIDEINRANISRVFGELITLIEPDKRSHGKIPLSCKLPSGEKFIVPSNLYLIGTMNTADKSIALLDIALRRRFEFVPMYPNYELEYEEKETLKLINERIIELKGYDFQIGHAYFMEDNFDLVECVNKKVIPLLLEYFLNDEKEVKGILSHAGLIIEENGWPLKIIGK
ncbi:MAG: AAA domain-containing protein [Bacteroidetes bacterium]|nr:AAA domain-containing protein [Bacteroidota bacterium]